MLAKKYRLAKDKDFKRMYKRAPKIKGAFLSIRYTTNQKSQTRFGVVVSNKTEARAVKRNVIKRKLRQALGGYLDRVKQGHDVIIKLERVPPVIKLEREPRGASLREEEISTELERLFKRGRLLK